MPSRLNIVPVLQVAARFFLVAPSQEDYDFFVSDDEPTRLGEAGALSWQALAQAYEDISYNARGWNISLWESSYRGKQARLLDASTLEVVGLYRAWGLVLRDDHQELPDHIGVMLTFALFLSRLTGNAAAQALVAFLEERVEFLLAGIEASIIAVRGRTVAHDKIAEVIRQIKVHIGSERARLKETLRTSPNRGNGDSQSDAPEAFASVADVFETYTVSPRERFSALHEATALREERRVPVAGYNNCGGRCAGTALVQEGVVLSIDFDTKRTPCAAHCERGRAYLSTFLSPRRLRFPLKRIGERGEGRFKRISWEDAIEEIAREWKRITERYGPESRYFNPGSGVCTTTMPDAFAKRLAALDGGFLDSYNSYSSACAEVTTPFIYGTLHTGNSSSTLRESRLIILWGHNPAESFFGSYLLDELLAAKAQGTRIIVIDPRRSATAQLLKAEWIPLRPTTDAALADGLAYVILSEGLEDRAFIDACCLGFDAQHMPSGVPAAENYADYLYGTYDGKPKTPEWAAEITGVPAEQIKELAYAYAKTKPAALIPGLGLQRHSNGEQSVRGCAMLACLTGNVGVAGGWAGGQGFVKGHPLFTVPREKNPYSAVIPSFLWTDAITRGSSLTAHADGVRGVKHLKAPVKLLFNLAGNLLINQHSDINRTANILKDTSLCEFIVVSDVFMTPSARFADILLPAPSFLETASIPYPWREGNFLLYGHRAIAPLAQCRDEYQWLKELARSLGLYERFTQGFETAEEWLEHLYTQHAAKHGELPPYAAFTRDGGHYYKNPPTVVAFKEQRDDPTSNPFPTPSGKIEICSERLYAWGDARIPATPRYVSGFEGPQDARYLQYPFQLIGWHTKRRAHSTHDNNPVLDQVERPFVHINSIDAQHYGVEEGALVEVFNDRGCTRIAAHISHEIMPGVLALAQGAWYTPDDDGVDTRGCINVLTTSTPTPLAKGNPQHSNLVALRLAARGTD